MTPEPQTKSDFTFAIDLRDVMAGAGVITTLAGAFVIHWGLAVVAMGAGLIGVAWRLAK